MATSHERIPLVHLSLDLSLIPIWNEIVSSILEETILRATFHGRRQRPPVHLSLDLSLIPIWNGILSPILEKTIAEWRRPLPVPSVSRASSWVYSSRVVWTWTPYLPLRPSVSGACPCGAGDRWTYNRHV